MKQTFEFTFTGWDALIEWHRGRDWSTSKVFWPTAECPGFWYALQHAGARFAVIGVSHIGNEVDAKGPLRLLNQWVHREAIDPYRCDTFAPTEPGELVVATDTAEVDWARTFHKVQQRYPDQVVVVHRTVREGREPSDVYLYRLGEITFGGLDAHGLLLGEDRVLAMIAGPALLRQELRDDYERVRNELLRMVAAE